MEAKRKEQLQANTQNGVANFQSYQPTFLADQDSGLRYYNKWVVGIHCYRQ